MSCGHVTSLPETESLPDGRCQAPDGSEYGLATRVVSVDPLKQTTAMSIRAEQWRDGALVAQEEHSFWMSPSTS